MYIHIYIYIYIYIQRGPRNGKRNSRNEAPAKAAKRNTLNRQTTNAMPERQSFNTGNRKRPKRTGQPTTTTTTTTTTSTSTTTVTPAPATILGGAPAHGTRGHGHAGRPFRPI